MTKKTENSFQNNQNYDASSIIKLENLEAVRKRPGMYIGSIDQVGLHHLVWEIFDNSIDEVLAGYGSKIKVVLEKKNYISIEDEGRGIPVDIAEGEKVSAVEKVLTNLHAGGKFNQNNYKTSGGLHGVGASVVNALSDHLEVWVKRNGKLYYQEFKNGGVAVFPLKEIEFLQNKNETGTKIRFHPDFSIMEKNNFNYFHILDRLMQAAYLIKNLEIIFEDQIQNKTQRIIYPGGIVDYVKNVAKNKKTISSIVYCADKKQYLNFVKVEESLELEVAFQYVEIFNSSLIFSYVNNIKTSSGGTHEQGFLDALTRIFNNYVKEGKLVKNHKDFKVDDIREGLVAIISLRYSNPFFSSQTKDKLSNKEVRQIVNKIVSKTLEKYLNDNPNEAKNIIAKILQNQKSRLAAQVAREQIQKKSESFLQGKLAHCATKNPQIAELFIVEGNSAGGSAKMGRDRNFQAILPLKGKVINAEKNNFYKVQANVELNSLISAIGTGIKQDFDLKKLKYQKIILMTDADVDGAHIRTLLLTFLYRHMRPLIEYGFVYIAQSPLYKIFNNKKIFYAYSDSEKQTILSKEKDQKFTIQRYKGLGEMDPEQLWETTMDPEKRTMMQVQIQDAQMADQIFTILMGEEVNLRRIFIEENARLVKNIDI